VFRVGNESGVAVGPVWTGLKETLDGFFLFVEGDVDRSGDEERVVCVNTGMYSGRGGAGDCSWGIRLDKFEGRFLNREAGV
jgi:hypothetical protein